MGIPVIRKGDFECYKTVPPANNLFVGGVSLGDEKMVNSNKFAWAWTILFFKTGINFSYLTYPEISVFKRGCTNKLLKIPYIVVDIIKACLIGNFIDTEACFL